MLRAKDIELQNLKESLNEALEKIWSLEQEIKVSSTKLDISSNEKHEMSRELMVLRKAKNQAEQNVSELKEKLRLELSKPR
jgi:chromosome segregation ATPase